MSTLRVPSTTFACLLALSTLGCPGEGGEGESTEGSGTSGEGEGGDGDGEGSGDGDGEGGDGDGEGGGSGDGDGEGGGSCAEDPAAHTPPGVVDDGEDLTIMYVQRLPELDYLPNAADPTLTGWPTPGETVTWVGEIRNYASHERCNIDYEWVLDGAVVESGTLASIPAEGRAQVSFDWSWIRERHSLQLRIDSSGVIAEDQESNNLRHVFTDAISVAFYVEESVDAYFHAHQRDLVGVYSNSWEDWAHRQITYMNTMFNNATPQVEDRVRIDRIHVVPDGALPLAGGVASNHPNMGDRSVDLQWGFNTELLTVPDKMLYTDTSTVADTNPFMREKALIHELGHARYLIDLYAFNVEEPGVQVEISEGGSPIVGTYLPKNGVVLYRTPVQGLMHSDYNYVDEHSAYALNRIAGARALDGNFNAPGNIGAYLSDLPADNQLRLIDQLTQQPMPGAELTIYRSEPFALPGAVYTKRYDAIPDLAATADQDGRASVGKNPFDIGDAIEMSPGRAVGTAIARAEYCDPMTNDVLVGYKFIDASAFNLAYWKGAEQLAVHDLVLDMWDTGADCCPTLLVAGDCIDPICMGSCGACEQCWADTQSCGGCQADCSACASCTLPENANIFEWLDQMGNYCVDFLSVECGMNQTQSCE